MILADSWYAKVINAQSFEELLLDKYPKFMGKLAKKVGLLRGILLYVEGRDYNTVVTAAGQKGSDVLMILSALSNKQNVILVEFLRKEQPKSYSLVARFTFVPVMYILRRWSLRRALLTAQVLTQWETDYYANIYKVEPARFKFIPWYFFNEQFKSENGSVREYDVFVSGRAALNWRLLFEAAKDQNWRIVIVCSKRDLPQVEQLSKGFNVKILSEISQEEHNKYLLRSSVCALPLKEYLASVGQIRIANAVAAKVPIVSTDIRGLDGYLTNNLNSLLTEVGNPSALRTAVNSLLQDEGLRKKLTENALLKAKVRPRSKYIEDINNFVIASSST